MDEISIIAVSSFIGGLWGPCEHWVWSGAALGSLFIIILIASFFFLALRKARPALSSDQPLPLVPALPAREDKAGPLSVDEE